MRSAISLRSKLMRRSGPNFSTVKLAMALPGSGRHILKAAGRGSRIELRRVISEARHDLGRLSRRAMQEVVAGPSPVFSFSPQPFVRLCDLVADEVDEIRLETTVGCIDAHPDRPEITSVLDGVTRRFEQVVGHAAQASHLAARRRVRVAPSDMRVREGRAGPKAPRVISGA